MFVGCDLIWQRGVGVLTLSRERESDRLSSALLREEAAYGGEWASLLHLGTCILYGVA